MFERTEWCGAAVSAFMTVEVISSRNIQLVLQMLLKLLKLLNHLNLMQHLRNPPFFLHSSAKGESPADLQSS